MKRTRLHVSLWCLGGLLFGSTALGQQDPREVVVRPRAATKAEKARPPLAPSRRAEAKRYWADYAGKAIRRSNLDGSNVETVASTASGPYAVTYDASTDYVVWTSAEAEVVQTAPADGSGETLTLNTGFQEHFALVVPGSTHNVAYGVEGARIVRVTENRETGAEQREVLYTLPNPQQVHGMALSQDHSALYLGDEAGRMTQKLNLSTLQLQPLTYDNSLTASSSEPEASCLAPCTQEPYPVEPYLEPESASSPRPSSTEKTR
jgi:hypothetical protein